MLCCFLFHFKNFKIFSTTIYDGFRNGCTVLLLSFLSILCTYYCCTVCELMQKANAISVDSISARKLTHTHTDTFTHRLAVDARTHKQFPPNERNDGSRKESSRARFGRVHRIRNKVSCVIYSLAFPLPSLASTLAEQVWRQKWERKKRLLSQLTTELTSNKKQRCFFSVTLVRDIYQSLIQSIRHY